MMTYDRRPVPPVPLVKKLAADPSPEEHDDIGELVTADYVSFLFALDTYLRYLQETGVGLDEIGDKGVRLLRAAETRHLDAIQAFLFANLPSEVHKRMVRRAFTGTATADNVDNRAFNIRTVLKRGGADTMRAVFESNATLRSVKAAMAALMIEDADAALDKFAVIKLANPRLRDWIDDAAKAAGSGQPPSPIAVAQQATSDAVKAVSSQKIQEDAAPPASIEAGVRDKAQDQIIKNVQDEATASAKKVMEVSGEPDVPPTKSEVIGIATAAAVAALTDPEQDKNVPEPLRRLDPEQRAAALTNGRVRVSAGAGSGKSTTLVARIEYLVAELKVPPGRILATSFNQKAGDELREKVARKLGDSKVSKKGDAGKAQVGTMHSVFSRFIRDLGNPAQQALFDDTEYFDKETRQMRKRGGLVSDKTIISAVLRAWKECFPNPDVQKDDKGNDMRDASNSLIIIDVPRGQLWKMPPKPGRMSAYLNKYQGQGWSVKQAQDWAKSQGTPEAIQSGLFYEMYEGFKGALGPEWRPRLCKDKTAPPRSYTNFVNKVRQGAPRVGDFSDQLVVMRDMLRNDPRARKEVQERFDHILVDECQDLNPVQFEVFQLMTEHIATDDPKKSFWMVGDDKQSIYEFRGSDPQSFIDLDKNGFKSQQITTNYRCAPEIVEAANKLIKNNQNQIPMAAKAPPTKARGEATIDVSTPEDSASAAVYFGRRMKQALLAKEPLSHFAVLARTNAELYDYETACTVAGVPFVRKGATSLFGSPETKTFSAFLEMTVSSDPEKLRKALVPMLLSTGRMVPKDPPEKIADTIETIFKAYCDRNRLDLKTFNPIPALMRDQNLAGEIVSAITSEKEGWKVRNDVGKLATVLDAVADIRGRVGEKGYTTKDLFADILQIETVEYVLDESGKKVPKPLPLQERLVRTVKSKMQDDDTDESDAEGDTPLGAINFFYQMLDKDPTETDIDPMDPHGFMAKVDRFKARAEELRIDPDKWEDEQKKKPANERQKPPGVYFGTVHSVKGAEWDDVTVLMPQGVFPMIRSAKEPKRNEVPEDSLVSADAAMESERRLGYVALTRAAKSLTILCPKELSGGRPGGISQFVTEAGLKVGSNVETKAPSLATEAVIEAAESGEEAASWDDFGAELADVPEVDEEPAEAPPPPPKLATLSYDRRSAR
jgi:superfamily I DNA/RNA helicase